MDTEYNDERMREGEEREKATASSRAIGRHSENFTSQRGSPSVRRNGSSRVVAIEFANFWRDGVACMLFLRAYLISECSSNIIARNNRNN